MSPSDFTKKETIKNERREFIVKVACILVVYIALTLWLNAIRANAQSWFLWALIIIQFVLYCLIFSTSLSRYQKCGLKFGTPIFIIFAILGRINDWEIIIIPLLIISMIIISSKSNIQSFLKD